MDHDHLNKVGRDSPKAHPLNLADGFREEVKNVSWHYNPY